MLPDMAIQPPEAVAGFGLRPGRYSSLQSLHSNGSFYHCLPCLSVLTNSHLVRLLPRVQGFPLLRVLWAGRTSLQASQLLPTTTLLLLPVPVGISPVPTRSLSACCHHYPAETHPGISQCSRRVSFVFAS